jgi:hypothetical protein
MTVCSNPACSKQVKIGTRNRPLKFCSARCRKKMFLARVRGNHFRAGKKKSLETASPVGTVTIRHDRYTKTPRAWIKVAEPDKWLPRAVVTWTAAGRTIPKGYILHHKDGDATNDGPGSIDNLELVTRAKHMDIHRPDFEARRLEGLRRRFKTGR